MQSRRLRFHFETIIFCTNHSSNARLVGLADAEHLRFVLRQRARIETAFGLAQVLLQPQVAHTVSVVGRESRQQVKVDDKLARSIAQVDGSHRNITVFKVLHVKFHTAVFADKLSLLPHAVLVNGNHFLVCHDVQVSLRNRFAQVERQRQGRCPHTPH